MLCAAQKHGFIETFVTVSQVFSANKVTKHETRRDNRFIKMLPDSVDY